MHDVTAGTVTSRPALTLDPILERLMGLHPRVIDLSLERIERLLDRIGNPEQRFPPTIHIAGSNGKGSTLALMRAMLEKSGRRVHAYTSPHLVRFNERVVVAGREISDAELIALLEECEAANGGLPITYFEITSAAAFLAFARAPADVLLLETGLGGRLDATNVLARPALTVISPVSIDHRQFLGDTLAAIAGEKAGILKSGVPCAVSTQPKPALAAIEKRADALGVELYLQGRDWSVSETAHGFSYRGRRWALDLPPPALAGAHQIDNAGLALAALETLPEIAIDTAALGAGLEGVVWPARLQRLAAGPLVEAAPAGWELWLDGGHNEAASQALAAVAAGWRDKPLYLIVAMVSSKDPESFFGPWTGVAAGAVAIEVPGDHASIPPADLAAAAGVPVTTARSVEHALADLASDTRGPARVLICGSLYLAGAILAENR